MFAETPIFCPKIVFVLFKNCHTLHLFCPSWIKGNFQNNCLILQMLKRKDKKQFCDFGLFLSRKNSGFSSFLLVVDFRGFFYNIFGEFNGASKNLAKELLAHQNFDNLLVAITSLMKKKRTLNIYFSRFFGAVFLLLNWQLLLLLRFLV